MIPLETQRLILRDFVESDWSEVHKYASDAEVVRYLTFGPNTEEDTKNFLQREISLQTELTQNTSQTLIPPCTLCLCGSIFRYLCVSPSKVKNPVSILP